MEDVHSAEIQVPHTLTKLSTHRWPSTSWWSQTTRRPRPRRRRRPSHPRPPATRRSPASSKISLILPLPWKCVSTDPRIRTSKGLSGAFAPKYTGIEAILSGINLVTFLVSIPSSFPPKCITNTSIQREKHKQLFHSPSGCENVWPLTLPPVCYFSKIVAIGDFLQHFSY